MRLASYYKIEYVLHETRKLGVHRQGICEAHEVHEFCLGGDTVPPKDCCMDEL